MRPAEIVMIEDNMADVLLLELALKENDVPYVLTRYENGIEAVRALCVRLAEDSAPRPDLVLLDLNTPRCDGFETLTKLQQIPHFAQAPMAILTSSRASADRRRAAAHGVRYIEKPSQLTDFLALVGQAVKEMLANSCAGLTAKAGGF